MLHDVSDFTPEPTRLNSWAIGPVLLTSISFLATNSPRREFPANEPGSKLVVLGMAIPPLIGNPYNGYINPYYWVDDHPLLYGNNGSLDPSTNGIFFLDS